MGSETEKIGTEQQQQQQQQRNKTNRPRIARSEEAEKTHC